MSEKWAQGGKPPGLRSAEWKPLKTWHLYDYGHTAACGATVMGAALAAAPGGVRLCRECCDIKTPSRGRSAP